MILHKTYNYISQCSALEIEKAMCTMHSNLYIQ